MNKPIYAEVSILDLSKIIFYRFIYEYVKPKWKNNAGYCYGDTDSYILHIKTKDFYQDIKDDIKE